MQRDSSFVERQAIEARTKLRREGLQPVERTFLIEGKRVAFQCHRGAEDAGTAAGAFLVLLLVRRGIGTEKEFWITRNRGLAQRGAMMSAFCNWQAVCMRPQPAFEQRITLDAQMMRGDGGEMES